MGQEVQSEHITYSFKEREIFLSMMSSGFVGVSYSEMLLHGISLAELRYFDRPQSIQDISIHSLASYGNDEIPPYASSSFHYVSSLTAEESLCSI